MALAFRPPRCGSSCTYSKKSLIGREGRRTRPAQKWSNPNIVVARAGEFGERPHAHGRSKDLHAKRIREASPPRYAALSSGADRTHFHNRQLYDETLTARHKVLQPRYHCRDRKRAVERLHGGECFVRLRERSCPFPGW